ncbi:uncharacterized protein LOC107262062 [Ricinus communis]|uniref:uncharacterized protein LOC107262062 n=1 Tax=Ricinus communis TaxID=3988 RepID=UPI000772742F|nr:uncharacterized protein LOC107262062 [Ricinus communis]|eukprot:XP_015580962.1 uncharacterized protein LOC107262062 [Ricinus communis]
MTFKGTSEFKEVDTRYSLQERKDLRLVRNTDGQVKVKCMKRNCPFVLYASNEGNKKVFQVKTFVDEDNCAICYKNRKVTAKWLASNYLYKYKCIATMKLVDIKKLVKQNLHIELTLTQLRRVKLLIILKIEGDVKKEFGPLRDYLGEVERSNPGSIIEMKFYRPLPEDFPIFQRLYISFDCLKRGLLAGRRRVLGLDGCFMKGVTKGKILAAIGRDGNNQMFPVAWFVVTSESYVTWKWFIKLLIKDLEMEDGDSWTIMIYQ